MAILKLEEIKISSAFSESVPSEKKMAECRNNWEKFNAQDRYIVLNDDYYLIDGYIQYLILREKNSENAEVVFSNKKRYKWHRKPSYLLPQYRYEATTYVYGVHPNDKYNKERIWRVPKKWKQFIERVQIGDCIFCETKSKSAPVIVTKIATMDCCPVEFGVKKVCSKRIYRNGLAVEA